MRVYISMIAAALVLGLSMRPVAAAPLAQTPPMGWNDWAHYQCDYTSKTIQRNAKALVTTGLAASGYDRVTIDDCWMAKQRNDQGNLKPNPTRFPNGMGPIAKSIHAMGLKFGIYEDAGSKTCGGYAGSGADRSDGKYHFARDIRLFKKWGVDYLKLDGCNVQVPKGMTVEEAYRKSYAAASAATRASGNSIILLESAPAYFQGEPSWYSVLGWVGKYGQLWRTGSDIATFSRAHPDVSRFRSVEWNYAYNSMLGRYQKPGNWDDPDFIIGGDPGMSLDETRSQMALWSMMSAPLILSVDVAKLSPASTKILSNKRIIAIDQNRLGKMATLVRRDPNSDVLIKQLGRRHYAIAVFNRSHAPINMGLSFADLGWPADDACSLSLRNLWTDATSEDQRVLRVKVRPHDTEIWTARIKKACGARAQTGAILMAVWPQPNKGIPTIEGYSQCLSSIGRVSRCQGRASELWTVAQHGDLRSGGKCLAVSNGMPEMQHCTKKIAQRWTYRRDGNLVNASDGLCLSASGASEFSMFVTMQACGNGLANQTWTLPN